jgi:hypothetical protein
MKTSRSRITLPLLLLSLTLGVSLVTACNGYTDSFGESNKTPGGHSSNSSNEETTAVTMAAYTVIATDACGNRQPNAAITVFQNKPNGQSIVNGTTDENGVYTFTAPKDSYCVSAVVNIFIPIIANGTFEKDATTLTVAIGDHPKNCPCFTEEETTVSEPDTAA